MSTAVISGGAGGLGRALATALQDQRLAHRRSSTCRAGTRAIGSDRAPVGMALRPHGRRGSCDRTCAAIRASTSVDRPRRLQCRHHPYRPVLRQRRGRPTARSSRSTISPPSPWRAHFLAAVRRSRGTHLAVSSVAGFTPLYQRTAYAASKHALEGFFKSLRSEEAPHGVRTVVAAPSFVATNIGNAGGDARRYSPARAPRRRRRLYEPGRRRRRHPRRRSTGSASDPRRPRRAPCMVDQPAVAGTVCAADGTKHRQAIAGPARRYHCAISPCDAQRQGP